MHASVVSQDKYIPIIKNLGIFIQDIKALVVHATSFTSVAFFHVIFFFFNVAFFMIFLML